MRYTHINIVAKDWKKLSDFYQKVFFCKPIGGKRDLSGEWLEKLTGMKNVKIEGEHLVLPGFKENAPTLEIFTYSEDMDVKKEINTPGFAHIAFEVDDVEKVAKLLLQEGGSILGEIVTKDYGEKGLATFVYAKDPEGNIVELQNWRV